MRVKISLSQLFLRTETEQFRTWIYDLIIKVTFQDTNKMKMSNVEKFTGLMVTFHSYWNHKKPQKA